MIKFNILLNHFFQSHDEDLVKVYCQNKNTFCDKMLEVLTTYAFAVGNE